MARGKKIRLTEPVVGKEEFSAVKKVLESGWLTEGPITKEFETEFAKFVGSKYAIATNNCTTALELCLRVLGIGLGDEVIVPDFTHPATADVVSWVGAHPVLVDVDLYSYNIDYEEVEKAITKKTKCIIPVSWGGNPLHPKLLEELKEKYDLFIVEDAACSVGAARDGVKTGTMADLTCFSFHPRKVITTGEGGMITTDNEEYAEKASSLKKFGEKVSGDGSFMEFAYIGTNYKLSDVLGAIGLAQLGKVNRIINKRIELAHNYNKILSDIDFIRPPMEESGSKHVFQTYAPYIELEGVRNKMIRDLKAKKIETQIGTYALHLHPAFTQMRRVGELERSTKLYENLLALPMCHSMTTEDQEFVVNETKGLLEKYRLQISGQN